MWQDLTEWTESGGCRRLRVWLWSAGCHTETTDGRCEALWSCHCGYSWSCCSSTSWGQKKCTLIKKKHQKLFQIWTSMGLRLTTFAVPQAHGTSHFEPSPSDWLWGEARWQRTRLQMPHPQSLWSCCCWGYCVFVGGERKHVRELKAALTL